MRSLQEENSGVEVGDPSVLTRYFEQGENVAPNLK